MEELWFWMVWGYPNCEHPATVAFTWDFLSPSPSIGCLRGNLAQTLWFCTANPRQCSWCMKNPEEPWRNPKIHVQAYIKKKTSNINSCGARAFSDPTTEPIHPSPTKLEKHINVGPGVSTNGGYPQFSSILDWHFPLSTTGQSSYWGTPMTMEPPKESQWLQTFASKSSHWNPFRSRACCIQRSAASSSPSWEATCKFTDGIWCTSGISKAWFVSTIIYLSPNCIENGWFWTPLLGFVTHQNQEQIVSLWVRSLMSLCSCHGQSCKGGDFGLVTFLQHLPDDTWGNRWPHLWGFLRTETGTDVNKCNQMGCIKTCQTPCLTW